MKTIAVFSDVHYGTGYLDRMLKDVKGFDYLFFLGDGLQSVLSMMDSETKQKLYYVEGNCDAMYQSDRIVDIEGKKFLLTHGNKYGVKTDMLTLRYKAMEDNIDVVCFGHTHQQYHEEMNGIHFVNPGALCTNGEYVEIIVEKGEIYVIPCLARL